MECGCRRAPLIYDRLMMGEAAGGGIRRAFSHNGAASKGPAGADVRQCSFNASLKFLIVPAEQVRRRNRDGSIGAARRLTAPW